MEKQIAEKEAMLEKIQSERSTTESLNNTLQDEKLHLTKDLEAAKLALSQKQVELKDMAASVSQLQQQLEKVQAACSNYT